MNAPEDTSQEGVRKPREWVVHKSNVHSSPQSRQLPCKPDGSIDGADGPAHPAALGRIEIGLRDLDIRENN